MKIPISCHSCYKEQKDSPNEVIQIYYIYQYFKEDGLYHLECPLGHKTKIPFLGHRFEFLYELGLYAILDGYFREAVASFTSSLERFYEFYINFIVFKDKIPESDFDKTWKIIANQSERQLGAFIFAYLKENSSSPELLSNSNIEFRNNVIHKGKFPNKEEALKYGKAVLDVIHPKYRYFTKNYGDLVKKHFWEQMNKYYPETPDGRLIIPTYLSVTSLEDTPRELDEHFKIHQERITEARNFPEGRWMVLKTPPKDNYYERIS